MSDLKNTQAELLARLAAIEAERDALRRQLKARPLGAATSQGDDAVAVQGEHNRVASQGGVVATAIKDSVVVTGDHILLAGAASGGDAASLEQAYLARLEQDCGILELSGVDPAAVQSDQEPVRLGLDAVYTALMTTTLEPESESRGELGEGPGPDQVIESRERRPLSALALADREPHLVLLGDPGSGKSTFVDFLTLCLARERMAAGSGLPLLTTPLPDDDGDDRESPQPWTHGALLPVPVVLRDFAAVVGSGDPAGDGLWTHLGRWLKACGLANYAPRLRETLSERGGLLLLDGLDEVPQAEHQRVQVIRAVESFAREFPRCRVLVTCRVYAYKEQDWALSRFHVAELAPLGDGQIRRFVRRWYQHSARLGRVDEQESARLAGRLEQALFEQPRLRELAGRPLLLTLMASLHAWRAGGLPAQREQFYGEVVDLLLDRWERRRYALGRDGKLMLAQSSLREYLATGLDKIRRELQRIAFEVHSRQGGESGLGRGTADIAESDLKEGLMRCAQRRDVKPLMLVDYLRERAGLLIFRGPGGAGGADGNSGQAGGGVYRFLHRSFQEYLAACHLATHDYPGRIAGLTLDDPDRWREVVLLTAAHISRGGELDYAVWPLVGALSRSGARTSRLSRRDAWGIYLGAEVLAELIDPERLAELAQGPQAGGDQDNAKILDRVRLRLAALLGGDQLLARERARAGDLLATLGDPRFDERHWWLPMGEEVGFVAIEGGEFRLGSDDPEDQGWNDPRPAHPYRLPDYWLARWPVTVAQFRAFVEHTGYDLSDPDCLEGSGNRPVVKVTWYDAAAYCRWLDGQLRDLVGNRLSGDNGDPMWRGLTDGSLHVTLPSEPEWEWAARGPKARVWPFSGEPDPAKANYAETSIGHSSSVGCFPLGKSPSGVEELAGNVWEWTRSASGDYPYPQSGEALQARETLEGNEPRVLRGGSFRLLSWDLRAAVRLHGHGDLGDDDVGFRVVLSPLTLPSGTSER